MFDIEETGIPNAYVNPDSFVRSVAQNSAVVSYWQKTPGNLLAPNQHNDLHFTLGVMLQNVAHFHATWHAMGTVTPYTCTADPNTGVLTTATVQANAGANNALGIALAIAPMIYRAVQRDDTARKLAVQKQKANQGGARNRLIGSAFASAGLKSKIVKPDATLKPHVDLKPRK